MYMAFGKNKSHNIINNDLRAKFISFFNANVLNKKAACLLTISDSLVKHTETTSLERQTAFNEMIQIALELAE